MTERHVVRALDLPVNTALVNPSATRFKVPMAQHRSDDPNKRMDEMRHVGKGPILDTGAAMPTLGQPRHGVQVGVLPGPDVAPRSAGARSERRKRWMALWSSRGLERAYGRLARYGLIASF